MPEVLRNVLVPIHPAGWPFISLFAILTLWCVYFFRNPDRVTPTRDGLVVSPADGMVQSIAEAVPPAELEMPIEALTRVSIFMNVFDVHVNRIPVDGRIVALGYRPGKFFNASLDKASEENERQAVRIRTEGGAEIAMVQIAGLIARRILCELEMGQPVRAGWRFGMIRFGSRLDVYLPKGVSPQVIVGQTAVAGETILADLQASEPPRRGETR